MGRSLMAVSKRLRAEILMRDSSTCRYCHATDSPLTIDHVVPTALGGTDDPTNLVAACKDCNAGKSSMNPDGTTVAQVSDDAVRWAAAMHQAAERYIASRQEADALCNHIYDHWESQNGGYRRGRAQLPDDFENSVDQWIRAGAPLRLIEEAINVAMRNKLVDSWNVWRYACGVVWTRIGQMQEEAKAVLTPPEPNVAPTYGDGWEACWNLPEVRYGTYNLAWLARVTDGLTYNITVPDGV